MSHQRFKSENYENLGGMNTKLSQYLTGPRNALSIYNSDFSVPGALTKRPGSTQYIGQTFPAKINTIYEYTKLDGSSMTIFSHTGGIWSGTSPLVGWSLVPMGDTGMFAAVHPGSAYLTSGTSIFNEGGITTIPNTAYGTTTTVSFIDNIYIQSTTHNKNNIDVLSYQNLAICVDGQKCIKFDGTTASLFGVPPTGSVNMWDNTVLVQGSTLIHGPYFNAYYQFYARLINNNGVVGPLNVIGVLDYTTSGVNNVVNAKYGVTYPSWLFNIYTPPQYGISGIQFFCYGTTSIDRTATIPFSSIKYVTTYAASGTYLTTITIGALALALLTGFSPDTTYNTNYMFGSTTRDLISSGFSTVFGLSTIGVYYNYNGFTANSGVVLETNINNFPSMIEEHANTVFFAGFSGALSTVWYSNLAEPEQFASAAQNFEVRTNDGDIITCIKSYQNRLMCMKEYSTHELSGDSTDNFMLRKISVEYGCINNKAATTWKNKFWFLDRKGIVEYNGAQIDIVSTPIETIINTINWPTAKTEACMVHNKSRNEIWTAVPVNGATFNNLMIIYDYLSDAWSLWSGPTPSTLAIMKRGFNIDTGFFGSYSGVISYFGSSFFGDNGVGITQILTTRFEHPEGQSMEKQFRRAFTNAESLTGASSFNLTAKLFKNYAGASVVETKTITQTKFQNYVNFGVSAKALSLEISHYSASDGLRIYGYTLEYRYQRKT
jgi:hypothetical protein